MKAYRSRLLLLAICISIPSGLMILVGVLTTSVFKLIFWGTIMAIWWGLWLYVGTGSKLSHWLSLAAVNVIWWPLCWQVAGRINYIYERGSMDGRTYDEQQASPMAFLMGFVGELIFFVPATLALVAGLLAFRRPKPGSEEA